MAANLPEEFPVAELYNSLIELQEILQEKEIRAILYNLLDGKELNEVLAAPFPMDLITDLVKAMPETSAMKYESITNMMRQVVNNVPATKKKGVMLV